jgi:hypothetical protein
MIKNNNNNQHYFSFAQGTHMALIRDFAMKTWRRFEEKILYEVLG